MCLKANAQNSLELFAMTCGNMTKDCAWHGFEFDIQCMHALKTSRQQRLGSEDVDTTHQRNRILIRFLHLVLSCGVPLEVSPKILKHYDKSYGIDQHERVSAGNVVRSRITLLCLKFDVLSVQYSCFLETLKHQMEHCTIFVRLTEKITIGSLESYENQHVQSAKPRIAFYTFLRLKMPNLIFFFDLLFRGIKWSSRIE